MVALWYALRSKPGKESALWYEASARGFDVFYPKLQVKSVNPRSRTIRPYFPGYLFIHVDLVQSGLSVFTWMPYSHGLVCFGDEPALVPDGLIVAIRRRVEEIAAAGGELLEALKEGDWVSILDGPFAGYEAIFDARLSGDERVRVLLRLMNKRQVPIDLSVSQIKRKDRLR